MSEPTQQMSVSFFLWKSLSLPKHRTVVWFANCAKFLLPENIAASATIFWSVIMFACEQAEDLPVNLAAMSTTRYSTSEP